MGTGSKFSQFPFLRNLCHSFSMISLRCVAKAVGFTLLLGQASAECKSLPPGHEMGKTTKVSIESEGVERSFLLTIPVLYDCEKATPLILSYHGESRDASQQLELSQMSNPFFNDFALVAYPQAANVRSSHWCRTLLTHGRAFGKAVLMPLKKILHSPPTSSTILSITTGSIPSVFGQLESLTVPAL